MDLKSQLKRVNFIIQKRLLIVDTFINRALDRFIPLNLTMRYLAGLGLIAGLAIAGQVVVQISFGRQVDTQRMIRQLDRQIPLTEEIRKAALSLQLSSNHEEAIKHLQGVRGVVGQLMSDYQQLGFERKLSNGAQRDSQGEIIKTMQRVQAAMAQITSDNGTGISKPRLSRSNRQAAEIRELIDATVEYRSAVSRGVMSFELNLDHQAKAFKRTEYLLFFSMLFMLFLEALYVFRPAVQRLYDALKARSEFLARMSHEIRNPMNSIIGMASLLGETTISDQQKHYLSVLRRASSGLLEMLNHLLDFSSLEAGKVKLDKIRFDLYELIEKCLDLAVFTAHANGTELILDLGPDVPLRVSGDSVRLQQVLSNLLGNAVKFTKKGYVTLRVRLISGNNGGVIQFSVIDTGVGIDKEKMSQIFEPFVQEDFSVRRKYGGSGLGLTIARELVERMGGKIHVSSEKGKGSEFSFTLSLNPEPASHLTSKLMKLGLSACEVALFGIDEHFSSVLENNLRPFLRSVTRLDQLDEAIHFLAENRDQKCVIVDFDRFLKESEHSDSKTLSKVLPHFLFILDSTAATESIERLSLFPVGGIVFKPIKPVSLFDSLYEILIGTTKASSEPTVNTKTPLKGAETRILVADDSKDNQLLIQAYLRSQPYSLTFVDNGREAVEKFKEGPFDIVLMDIQMPELDGYAATEQIRKWETSKGTTKKVPILALSAHSISNNAAQYGFTDCLVKPISAYELHRVITKLTAQGQPPSPSLSANERLQLKIAALVPTYLEHRKKELLALKEHLEKGDFTFLERVGHQLKGNAVTYGFPELGDLGSQLEKAAQEHDLTQTRSLIPRIEDCVLKAEQSQTHRPS